MYICVLNLCLPAERLRIEISLLDKSSTMHVNVIIVHGPFQINLKIYILFLCAKMCIVGIPESMFKPRTNYTNKVLKIALI